MPWELIREILAAGIRAILISAAIEIAILVLACVIAIGVWIANGFITGMAAGIITFAIGQVIAVLIIDMILLLDERPRGSTLEQSDRVVLAELRKELEKTSAGDAP